MRASTRNPNNAAGRARNTLCGMVAPPSAFAVTVRATKTYAPARSIGSGLPALAWRMLAEASQNTTASSSSGVSAAPAAPMNGRKNSRAW